MDYPAAHSMDTTWFAIDDEGHVSAFHTGETGHVPDHITGEIKYRDLLQILQSTLPSVDDDDFDWDEFWETADEAISERGVFVFGYIDGGWFQKPYQSEWEVPEPIHVDQLPPDIRHHVRQCQFSGILFRDVDHLQPIEHVRCWFWDQEGACGYIGSDEKTLHPIEGREQKFVELIRRLQEQDHHSLEGKTIAHPDFQDE